LIGGGVGPGAFDGGERSVWTISRTFAWPFSNERNANVLEMVAAALPMATPAIVPPTPKNERANAASTAPTTEAMTCFQLSFMA
jgi:hypothetical protein